MVSKVINYNSGGGSSWVENNRYEYEYDAHGNLTEERYYDYIGGTAALYSIKRSTYNEDNYLLTYTYSRSKEAMDLMYPEYTFTELEYPRQAQFYYRNAFNNIDSSINKTYDEDFLVGYVYLNQLKSTVTKRYYYTPFEVPSSLEEEKMARLQIYPNPVKDYLYIQNSQQELMSYDISNVNGQVVMSSTFNTNTQAEKINVANLPAGLYFLKAIFKNEQTSVQKFIKE